MTNDDQVPAVWIHSDAPGSVTLNIHRDLAAHMNTQGQLAAFTNDEATVALDLLMQGLGSPEAIATRAEIAKRGLCLRISVGPPAD